MSIIQKQTIKLNSQFEVVRDRIQTIAKFKALRNVICSFNEQKKSIIFQTEKIHPLNFSPKTQPVMLLFSNPHPLSVQAGMFLSEPRSRVFWKRLFNCKYIDKSNQELLRAISEWSEDTIEILSTNLLNPNYSDEITLFFDCLESLPTNQYSDLRTILPNNDRKNLRKNILQIPGRDNLAKISKQNNISSWVVFSAEAYRNITGKKNLGLSAPDRICRGIDEYQLSQNNNLFWKNLEDLKRVVTINGRKITVYLALIARRKNQQSQTGAYYFTVMLDQIFKNIIKK